MDITLTLARLMDTTDLTGSPVECLSAPARGMAGVAVGVGAVGVMATMVAEAGAMDGVAMAMVAGSLADADLSADEDSRVVRLAGSTVQLAVVFMEAVRLHGGGGFHGGGGGFHGGGGGFHGGGGHGAVADIGNSGLIRSLLDR